MCPCERKRRPNSAPWADTMRRVWFIQENLQNLDYNLKHFVGLWIHAAPKSDRRRAGMMRRESLEVIQSRGFGKSTAELAAFYSSFSWPAQRAQLAIWMTCGRYKLSPNLILQEFQRIRAIETFGKCRLVETIRHFVQNRISGTTLPL